MIPGRGLSTKSHSPYYSGVLPIAVIGPLAAAFVYSVGTAAMRTSSKAGVSPLTQLGVANITAAVLVVGAITLTSGFSVPEVSILESEWIWAPIGAFVFVAGQSLTLLALWLGDSSVQTPLMGTKAVFVAIYTSLFFGEVLGPGIWIAVALVAVGVFFIGLQKRRVVNGWTILAALGSSVVFAFSDVVVSQVGRRLGREPFLTTMLIVVGVVSVPFLFVPLVTKRRGRDKGRRRLRRPHPGLVVGSALIGVQFAVVIWVLSTYGNAPRMNVLYATRGLWSVVLLFALNRLGHGRHMEEVTAGVLARRFVAAGLLVVAIVIVL